MCNYVTLRSQIVNLSVVCRNQPQRSLPFVPNLQFSGQFSGLKKYLRFRHDHYTCSRLQWEHIWQHREKFLVVETKNNKNYVSKCLATRIMSANAKHHESNEQISYDKTAL